MTDPFDHPSLKKLLFPMWIVWAAFLLTLRAGGPDLPANPHTGADGDGEGFSGFTPPHYQPVANANVPTLPLGSPFNPAPPISPVSPPSPGPLGQASGSFSPPAPSSSLPVQLYSVPLPSSSLGMSQGAVEPSAPVLSFGLTNGGVPQISPPASTPSITYFAMGPSSLLNQFAQPPMVPFGQVGVQPQPYVSGLSVVGTFPNPFTPTCNYYFFPNCGQNGGFSTNFRYSTR
ncbi:hypothetical protein [Leptospirillum ferriphilum]|jgi:hypothetical protein|uniref:Uncharacterized protein n=3 Tax=Leptospirillum ferriphilum TaxID=178606 RepID=A0A059XS81_9BACT|nr:hypothetical protein [Leptospirillum ferriphilum]AFS52638.1 hypothetical protein LFML04_0396 [Leptospirillum ferriphilum ML-04]AIA31459.1 hypothetical protein Y981_02030 [Leptospirillum ferriphilum YSK]OOH72732.1 hypothetical protein BOX24_04900 [Leptospirillum ferriphilum]OOH79044.1 hypothetical protein BOX30_07185 [Leptospirillum ferriphilum]